MKELCVIIVDDQELPRRALKRILGMILREQQLTHVPIIAVEGGAEALRLVREHDEKCEGEALYLLLSDGDMPDMTGPETIESLDAMLGERLLLRALVSSNPIYRAHADRLSVTFVEKPYAAPDIRPIVDRFLSLV